MTNLICLSHGAMPLVKPADTSDDSSAESSISVNVAGLTSFIAYTEINIF